MKKLIIAFITLPFISFSQIKITTKGLPKIKLEIPNNKVFKLDKVKDTILTSNTAIYQNITYPVYAIKQTGKMYIALNSKKTGKYYRKYIKEN